MMSGGMMIGLMSNHFNICNNCDIYKVKEIMGKVIKLKENDIQRIIKKVLKEGEEGPTINVPIKGGYLTINKVKNRGNVIKACVGGKCYNYTIKGGTWGVYYNINFKTIRKESNGNITIDRYVDGGKTEEFQIKKVILYSKLVPTFKKGKNTSFEITTPEGEGTVVFNRV